MSNKTTTQIDHPLEYLVKDIYTNVVVKKMPILNKVQLQFLQENLISNPLPEFNNVEEEKEFMYNFLSVVEKIIGLEDLGQVYRQPFIEILIDLLKKDKRLLQYQNPRKQNIQSLNLVSCLDSGDRQFIGSCIDLVVQLLDNKKDLDQTDFAYEKFKTEGSDEEKEYFKIILRAIRSQNNNLSSRIYKNMNTLKDMDEKLVLISVDQQKFIDDMTDTNSKLMKIIDDKSNEIEDLKSSMSTLIEELYIINSTLQNQDEFSKKLNDFEKFRSTLEDRLNDNLKKMESQVENSVNEVEQRIAGRLQFVDQQQDRLITRVATVETKLNLEVSRISFCEQNFEKYTKTVDDIEIKYKNIDSIIDEMRKMFYTRISKVENNYRNFNTNSKMRNTSITNNLDVNQTTSTPYSPNKSQYASNSPIPNRKTNDIQSSPFRMRNDTTPDKGQNSIKNITIDDNMNHEELLEHLSETSIIDKADYVRSGMDRERKRNNVESNKDGNQLDIKRNSQNMNKDDELNYINNQGNTFNKTHNRNDNNQNYYNQSIDHLSEKVSEEIEQLKTNFDMIHKKHLDIISQINSDSTNIAITKHESDIMDIKTEIITLKKSLQDVQQAVQPEKLNMHINDFKIEIDNIIKSIKHDVRSDKFDSKITHMQAQIDKLNSNGNNSTPKFDKNTLDNPSPPSKKDNDVNHLSIEIQRVSVGLNNLYNFTQAQIDTQAQERERMIHSELGVKDKIDCMEFIAKNLEFISDEAIHAVVKSFLDIATSSTQGSNFKHNIGEQKYTGKITSHIMDMVENYSVEDTEGNKDKNSIRNIRELLNILRAVLMNKSNVKLLNNQVSDDMSIDFLIIRKLKQCDDEFIQIYGLQCITKMLEQESIATKFAEKERFRDIIEMSTRIETKAVILNCGILMRVLLRSDLALDRIATSGEDLPTTIVQVLEKQWMHTDVIEEWLCLYRNQTRKVEQVNTIDSTSKINRVVEIAQDNNLRELKHIATGIVRNVCKNQEFSQQLKQINASDLLLNSNYSRDL